MEPQGKLINPSSVTLIANGGASSGGASQTSTPTPEFTPQNIAEIYEVLAPMATDYANANIERAGQAQASIGPLAEAVMGGSRTAGIGNYTYNRLVRPAVDTLRDQLLVEGYSAALNRQLSDSLNAAKRNYNRAARRRNNPSTDPDTTGGGQTKIGGYDDVDTGQRVTGSPLELYKEFTIIDQDGTEHTYQRSEVMTDDVQWFNLVQRSKQKAESEGKTFKYGS